MARKSVYIGRYGVWRDGRPRFELGGKTGKALREAGFSSMDLKDSAGNWLSFEAACQRVAQLNAAVDAWREGTATSPSLAPPPPPAGAETLDHFIAAFLTASKGKRSTTRSIYTRKARPLSFWLGHRRVSEITRPSAEKLHATLLDVAHWKEANGAPRSADCHPMVRALSLPAREALRADRLEHLETLADPRQAPGYTMAYDVTNLAAIIWNHARDAGATSLNNPFSRLKIAGPRGRIRFLEDHEIAHLVDTADAMGCPEGGDLIITALHTLQRREDLRRLDRAQLEAGQFDITQSKTNKRVRPAVTEVLARRGREMRQRHESILGTTRLIGPMLRDHEGRAFTYPDALTALYGKVRDEAAKTMPSLADSQLNDLRDTGVTRLFIATMIDGSGDMATVMNTSGHSYKSLDLILKHYLHLHPAIAANGAKAYNRLISSTGLRY